jgi:hypothetical protein
MKRSQSQRAKLPPPRILQWKGIPKLELQALLLAYRLFSPQPIHWRLERQEVQSLLGDSWLPSQESAGSPLGLKKQEIRPSIFLPVCLRQQ